MSTSMEPKTLMLALRRRDVGQDLVIDTSSRGAHRVQRQPVVLGRPGHHGVGGQRQPPAGPQRLHRRVPKDGVVMVAGQRLRVGRTHAGTIITVMVEDHHFRVLDETTELSRHARTINR